MRSNYYVEQIRKALKDHDFSYPVNIKISGSKNSGNNMTLPIELLNIIEKWYRENGV